MPVSCGMSHRNAPILLSRHHPSVGGRPVKCDGGLRIRASALTNIHKSDLIFIPSTGPADIDVVGALLLSFPSCGAGTSERTSRASVQAPTVAAAGLLDGKRRRPLGTSRAISSSL
jgi:hypothetical protein